MAAESRRGFVLFIYLYTNHTCLTCISYCFNEHSVKLLLQVWRQHFLAFIYHLGVKIICLYSSLCFVCTYRSEQLVLHIYSHISLNVRIINLCKKNKKHRTWLWRLFPAARLLNPALTQMYGVCRSCLTSPAVSPPAPVDAPWLTAGKGMQKDILLLKKSPAEVRAPMPSHQKIMGFQRIVARGADTAVNQTGSAFRRRTKSGRQRFRRTSQLICIKNQILCKDTNLPSLSTGQLENLLCKCCPLLKVHMMTLQLNFTCWETECLWSSKTKNAFLSGAFSLKHESTAEINILTTTITKHVCCAATYHPVSVSRSTPLACENLVQPFNRVDTHVLLGRWVLIAGRSLRLRTVYKED